MRDYSFGNFLYELRMRRGLTQFQLGMLVGVSDKAVSKWENGSSKPQSSLLYKLSGVLGVSVDELLACKYHAFQKKAEKGVFAMRKQLWNKAAGRMEALYGGRVPLQMANRFLTERMELENTDAIVYFDLLGTLTGEAKKEHTHICVRGAAGASFTAYLLGATSINPLPPHYYCPECGRVLFESSAKDGWDLPPKQCLCGKQMVSNGHDIPFEACRSGLWRNGGFDVSVPPQFMECAKAALEAYFQDCKVAFSEREAGRIVTATVASEGAVRSITLCADREIARYGALEAATGIAADSMHFFGDEVLQAFRRGNTDGIPDFRTAFMKEMIKNQQPKSFFDLIQILGFAHSTGPAPESGLAYREDVFRLVQERMESQGLTDTGFACKVMTDASRGVYAKTGISTETRMLLAQIGMPDSFCESLERTQYLFPKAVGVGAMEQAVVLMWYKINCQEKFTQHMLCG